jgi:hypothetical protein
MVTDICGIQCNVVIFDLTTGRFHDNSIHAEAYEIGIIIIMTLVVDWVSVEAMQVLCLCIPG